MSFDIKKLNKSKYELLAPAGNFDALKAAVSAGCDAVYCGGNMFGARAFANNFSTEELIEAIDYCHTYGKALYLTVNTLLKNDEISQQLYEYIKPLYEAGLDAVIVQDLGVLKFIKEHFPDMEIHGSTQMTILGSHYAEELKNLGLNRVVTPRELSLSEIKDIYNKTGLEIECFIHGALCYCYSGQCLMSSLIGGRSGNRGKCAQPCRLPYSLDNDKKQEFFISPKDLCSVYTLPKILSSGVYSLKIEGRMKNPEYVYVVTSIYRKYIDMYEKYGKDKYSVDIEDFNKLLDIYNRGGFTEGFFEKQNSKDIIYTKKPNHMGVKAGVIKKIAGNNIYFDSLIDLNKNDVLEFRLKNKDYISFNLGSDYKKNSKCTGFLYKKNVKNVNELFNTELYRTKNSTLEVKEDINKLKVNGDIVIKTDQNIIFTVSLGDLSTTLTFDVPSKALKQALNRETIIKQLNKTGNECFDFEHIEVCIDDDLFVPMGVLNNIRRDTLESFRELLINLFKRNNEHRLFNENDSCNNEDTSVNLNEMYSALVSTREQLDEVLLFDEVNIIYVEQANNSYEDLLSMCDLIRKSNKIPYLAIAHITRTVFLKDLRKNMKFYLENSYEGYMFRNLETFFMFKKENIDVKKVVFDSNIYTFNNFSYMYYKELGAEVLTASYEHNLKELQNMNKSGLELNIYGYIPVMVSANCVYKTAGQCDRNFKSDLSNAYKALNDRFNNQFKVMKYCRYCYNIIYNNVPLSSYDEMYALKEYGFSRFRINFTLENRAETNRILNYYLKNDLSQAPLEYTKGHLKRGV